MFRLGGELIGLLVREGAERAAHERAPHVGER